MGCLALEEGEAGLHLLAKVGKLEVHLKEEVLTVDIHTKELVIAKMMTEHQMEVIWAVEVELEL